MFLRTYPKSRKILFTEKRPLPIRAAPTKVEPQLLTSKVDSKEDDASRELLEMEKGGSLGIWLLFVGATFNNLRQFPKPVRYKNTFHVKMIRISVKPHNKNLRNHIL